MQCRCTTLWRWLAENHWRLLVWKYLFLFFIVLCFLKSWIRKEKTFSNPSLRIKKLRKKMGGGVRGGEDHWEAWNWSCEPMRGLKNNCTRWLRQTNRQINKQTEIVTLWLNRQHWGQFSENIKWIKPIPKNNVQCPFFVTYYILHIKLHISYQIINQPLICDELKLWCTIHTKYAFNDYMNFSICLSFWCRHNQRQKKEQECE